MERFKCCQIGRFLKASLFSWEINPPCAANPHERFVRSVANKSLPHLHVFLLARCDRGNTYVLERVPTLHIDPSSPREGQSRILRFISPGDEATGSPCGLDKRAPPNLCSAAGIWLQIPAIAVWQAGPQSAFYYICGMRRSGNADFLCALTSGGTLRRRGETTHTTQGSIKKAKRSIALPFLENYTLLKQMRYLHFQ